MPDKDSKLLSEQYTSIYETDDPEVTDGYPGDEDITGDSITELQDAIHGLYSNDFTEDNILELVHDIIRKTKLHWPARIPNDQLDKEDDESTGDVNHER